jgi:hypothetical protein
LQVRLYPHNNKFYKSVTSIILLVGGIPEELNRWSVKLGVQAVLAAPTDLDEKRYLELAEQARLDVLHDAQVKGRTVHSWIENSLSDAPASIDPEYEPYYRAFLRFRAEHDISPIMLEKTVVNEDFGYAGQFDFYGLVDGEPCLLDFKTSKSLHESYGYQLAAYREVLERSGFPVHRTAILHLRPSGRYTLKEYNVSFGHFVHWITVAEDMCRTLRVQYVTATVDNALIAEGVKKKATSYEVAEVTSPVGEVVPLTSIQGLQSPQEDEDTSSTDDELIERYNYQSPRTYSGQVDKQSPETESEESPSEPQTETTRKARQPRIHADETSSRIEATRLRIPDDDVELSARVVALIAKRQTSPDSYETH